VMRVMGFDLRDVARLMTPLLPDDGEHAGSAQRSAVLATRFARAAWTVIAEPGDGIAGALIASLGALDALERVLVGVTAARLRDELMARDPVAEPDDDELRKALLRWEPRRDQTAIVRALEQASRVGSQLLTPGDPGWPVGLADLGVHAPYALWCRGDVGVVESLHRSIAIVGARAATGYGEHVTSELAAGLVDRGFAVVSGAAYGIDAVAHRAALASDGTTVAFLAGGVDRFYPAGNDDLLHRVMAHGAVYAETPCGTAPTKWRFLARNRLIAAASRATVVVEAGRRSGALNTASHAAALGRPLGAVPGAVSSPASEGCHRLIRENDAICVTRAGEAAELVLGVEDDMLEMPVERRPSNQVRVLDALSTRSARAAGHIATRSGLSLHATVAALGALEVEGVVRERDGQWLAVPRRG